MKFDLLGLIFMVIAIWVGNFLGPMLGGFVGLGAGLIGAFISGIVIYLIYSMLTGSKMSIMGAVIFAIAVYASTIITGYITGMFGFISGIFATFVQAIFVGIIFSWVAPKAKAEAPKKVPVKV